MTMPDTRGLQPIGRELRRLFIRLLMNHAEVPDRLYLGLSTEVLAPNANMSTVEAFELDAPGYVRQTLGPREWDIQDVADGAKAVAEARFVNTSEGTWPSVAATFLSTSQSGAGGALVAITALQHGPRELRPGDILQIPILIDYSEEL